MTTCVHCGKEIINHKCHDPGGNYFACPCFNVKSGRFIGWHPTNRFTPRSEEQSVVDWPNSEGLWMGLIPEIGWFPLKAKRLKTYENEAETKMMPFVAQFPESETSWPFTFQGCHPAKQWRVPTDDELARAKHFYGERGTGYE